MAKHRKYKKQHYLPACYLKAWCDPVVPENQTPFVWIFDKTGGSGRRKAPEKIFRETDLYTIHLPDDSRDLRLEHGLNKLESMFSSIRIAKLDRGGVLTLEEHVTVCAFVSAMHSRTPERREHWRKQWERPLKMMDQLADRLRTATREQKRSMTLMSGPVDKEPTISHDQVRRLVETPLQTLLPTLIEVEAPIFAGMDAVIFETDNPIGFITSDAPCVIYDTNMHKFRSPFHGVSLISQTVEVLFPISPRRCFFLNRQGVNGYVTATNETLLRINQSMAAFADRQIVASMAELPQEWFNTQSRQPQEG